MEGLLIVDGEPGCLTRSMGGVLHFFLLSLEWGCGGRVAETFADPFCDNFGEIVAADWK